MGETDLQLFAEPSAVPLEEILVGTEDCGEDVGGDAAAAQLAEVIEPELVLDEEDDVGSVGVEHPPHVAGRVHGEVADEVGLGVVLAHLVARG